MPKSKTGYKTKRKYGCPYCDIKLPRSELVPHVEEEHEMMIPEGYNAARVVYDHINGKNYGTCMICGNKVYEWDNRVWRYKNLCDNPKCRQALTEKAKNNHLDDPEKQKIMLQGRRISGEYTFRDGGKRSYVGSYEKKTLEFMDKVMNIPSTDIMTPGPTFTYQYDGKEHAWITDILYIPAKLVIDVKDGGKNPNTRPMESYREKQVEKEKVIIENGEYNYLRLTDNDFGQLMSAIADIRYGEVVEDKNKGIYINEHAGTTVMVGSVKPYGKDYIIPRMMKNGFTEDDSDPDTFIFGNTEMDLGFMLDESGNVVIDNIDKLIESTQKVGDKRFRKIIFNTRNSNMAKLAAKLRKEREEKAAKKKSKAMIEIELASIMSGAQLLTHANIYAIPNSSIIEYNGSKINEFTEMAFLIEGASHYVDNILHEAEYVKQIGRHTHVMYDREKGAYYLSSNDSTFDIASPSCFGDINSIDMNIVQLMDDLYQANLNRKADSHE